MIKRIIKSSVLRKNPYEKWNQFIDLIATEGYHELSSIQRVAHLTFWLDSEIQNGGFIQYFTNIKGDNLNETIVALSTIGAEEQKKLLCSIINLYEVLEITNLKSKDEFIQEVLVGYNYVFEDDDKEARFDELVMNIDKEYYNIKPTITDLLQNYLNDYEEEFIEVIEEELMEVIDEKRFLKRLFNRKN